MDNDDPVYVRQPDWWYRSTGSFLSISRAEPLGCSTSAHRVMEHLAKYPNFHLNYCKYPTTVIGLDGFCDANWGISSSRQSTTGNLLLYCSAPVLWKSKLQKTTALSTAEVEYYSASAVTVEVIYLRSLLILMGFVPQSYTPVYEDNLNNTCIEWSNVIGRRKRAKHIDIRKHFAHEVIQNGHFRLVRVDTSEQLADIFIKSLQSRLHAECMAGILPWVVVCRKRRRATRGDKCVLSKSKLSPRRPL